MNEILKCLVADDEDLAIKLLEAYIQQTAGLEVALTVAKGKQVPLLLQQNHIDILFLDIQMPSINGLQLAEQLTNPPMIVFTTAYANYAVDGFRLHAMDYLLKPFSYERFLQAVNRCKEYYQYQKLKEKKQYPDCIYVKADGKMVKILLNDILFIKGWKQYIKIYTPEKSILTLESMKNMEENLPAAKFIRVHKSYIVAFDKVDTFTANEIHVMKHTINVGKTYRDSFKKYFTKNN